MTCVLMRPPSDCSALSSELCQTHIPWPAAVTVIEVFKAIQLLR